MAIWHEVISRLDHPDVWGPSGLFPLDGFRRAGGGYLARCPNPAHPDRHPSFSMPRGKAFGRCFACGYRRGWIGFVMEQRGASVDARGEPFWAALRVLAGSAGVALPDRREGKTAATAAVDPATRCRAAAAQYLRHALRGDTPAAQRARAYLAARGIDEGHLPLLPLGVLDDPGALSRALRAAGCSATAIRETGLFAPYMARHCLIFLYTDGQTVTGFKGRIPDRSVKEVRNAKGFGGELEGRSLFGLDLADEAIAASGRAILVEGEFDALAIQSALLRAKGATVELVTLGGAAKPTREKFQTLRRLGAQVVYLALDGDRAGERATAEALPLAWAEGLAALVLPMPEGVKDPDEALQRLGLERCLQEFFSLSRAMAGSAWLAGHLVRTREEHPEGRLRLRQRAVVTALSIPAHERKAFLDPLAAALAEPVDTLAAEVRVAARAARETAVRERVAAWAREFRSRVLQAPALPAALEEAENLLGRARRELDVADHE